jgi:hypothetical protein
MLQKNELLQRIIEFYEELGSNELLEEYNLIFNTDLTEDDINWE